MKPRNVAAGEMNMSATFYSPALRDDDDKTRN